MALVVCPLFSGSKGNACFVASDRARILVDVGGSARKIQSALEQIGCSLSQLDAILITHEHIDHISALGVIARKSSLPIYANEGTWAGIRQTRSPGRIPVVNQVEYAGLQSFGIGDMEVIPFAVSHDACAPVGYSIRCGGSHLAIMTDTGYMTSQAWEVVRGTHCVVLESNHDPGMLFANPRYSQSLKARISGEKGHLSNEDAAETLSRLVASGTRQVYLAHLSQENNTPACAFDTAAAVLASRGIIPGEDVAIHIAWQDHISEISGF